LQTTLSGYIKNSAELLRKDINESQFKLRKIGIEALEIALNAVKPINLIENSIRIQDGKLVIQNEVYDLKNKEIIIIGAGKATAEMLLGMENLLNQISNVNYKGIINVPEGLDIDFSKFSGKIKINLASHPIPNQKGLDGAKVMMNFLKQTSQDDLVICLISGGGSSLLPLPKEGVSLEDLQILNALLLASGASIHEINAIRKHLSQFKGGNLAKALYNASGAKLITLIISDVVGDNLDSIASGPTVPDLTTFQDTITILKKYALIEKIPISIKNILERGSSDILLENPKASDPCFKNTSNYLIGSVASAVQELEKFFITKGFLFEYFNKSIMGEADDFGRNLYSEINHLIEKLKRDQNAIEKICLIGTGELTVTVKGKGIGGRNQEMLLSFLDILKNEHISYQFLLIGANLDGIEGNSKAMGALVDNESLKKILQNGIDTKIYLCNNNSNSFFNQIKDEIISGPTGCNVNDLLIIIINL